MGVTPTGGITGWNLLYSKAIYLFFMKNIIVEDKNSLVIYIKLPVSMVTNIFLTIIKILHSLL